ncbi:hypothetical protein Tco_0581943 [Tanacetum coccineum]
MAKSWVFYVYNLTLIKKQNTKQAAQILRLKTKIKILVKKVKPVIAEYRSFLKLKATLSKKKKLKKTHKKKSSSFKQGRKKVNDGSTGLNEVDVNLGDSQMMDVDDTISAEVHEGTAEVIEGTEEVHEGTAQVHENEVIRDNQEDWEIIRWRLNESSRVHTLELEDGTMLHMLAERRYPLSRELMIRMLDHGMEVKDESEIAITLIHLFILWTTEDGDDS